MGGTYIKKEVTDRIALAKRGSPCATCLGMLGCSGLSCPFGVSVHCQMIGGDIKTMTRKGIKCPNHQSIALTSSVMHDHTVFKQLVEQFDLPMVA
jgi:hypothetical protein